METNSSSNGLCEASYQKLRALTRPTPTGECRSGQSRAWMGQLFLRRRCLGTMYDVNLCGAATPDPYGDLAAMVLATR